MTTIAQLLEKWEARSRDALPSDAMLINKHIRELREAVSEPPPIDYKRLVRDCYATTQHAQGTPGCKAFARGAEWYREQVVAPKAQKHIMPKGASAAAQLRAMATNYPAGHLWDKLDAQACIRGALEIEALLAAPKALAPLGRDTVKVVMSEAGYTHESAQSKADFINGIRHGEKAHGIGGTP